MSLIGLGNTDFDTLFYEERMMYLEPPRQTFDSTNKQLRWLTPFERQPEEPEFSRGRRIHSSAVSGEDLIALFWVIVHGEILSPELKFC